MDKKFCREYQLINITFASDVTKSKNEEWGMGNGEIKLEIESGKLLFWRFNV